MTLETLTAIMSSVGKSHPELVTDEKVRRYILLVVEEGRRFSASASSTASLSSTPPYRE